MRKVSNKEIGSIERYKITEENELDFFGRKSPKRSSTDR